MNKVTFHQKLISVMTDNKYDRMVSNQKSGKLDGRKIYKISRSNKIFKKGLERKGKFYNISLVIDVSSSMSGDRIETATKSIVALAKHFKKMDINFEIMAFNQFMYQLKDFNEKCPDLKILEETLYELTHNNSGRYNGVRSYETKECYSKFLHPEKAKDLMERDRDYDEFSPTGTHMAEAVFFARRRLEKMKGERIMVVLADGGPNSMGPYISPDNPKMTFNDYNLEKEAAKILKKNIHLVAVGIQTGRMKDHFPKESCIEVNDLNDLYTGIINRLSKQIKRH